jgi:hypothetical protein
MLLEAKRSVAVFVASIWLAACVSYDEPLARETEARAPFPPSFLAFLSAVNVRVRRPRLTDPLPPEYEGLRGLAPADILEFRTWDADHVVSSLSESGLFASVAYADTGPVDRALPIEAVLPPQKNVCDGDAILLPFLTLGLLPASCEHDRGVYFRFLGRHLPDFSCRWPQTEMWGWLPVLLSTRFGHGTREPDVEAFRAHIRSCILAASDAFERAVRSP